MKIIAALGLGLLVMALVAFEVTVGDGSTGTDAGLAAGLFAGAAIYDLCFGIGAYLAPTWIALSRAHPESTKIAALNLVLGWTVLGWLIAMLWALSRPPAERAAAAGAGLQRYR